jgi:hypothetical protein
MYEDLPRSHDWLIRYATQRVRRFPRVGRYLAGVLAQDRTLGFEEILAGPVERGRAYHLSRGGAALIGRKAFLWRTPGTALYGSEAVAEEALSGLRVFRSRQRRDGDFAMGDAWAGHLPHHSHAWRMEPMIWARIWLEPFLSPAERGWIDAMLRRAARRLLWFARESPNDTLQYCNRGAVWCAVTTLAGLYFDEREYVREVERHAERVLLNTLTPRGEALENYLHYSGGGPDAGYSFTTWAYAMMYRLLSGRGEFDERLVETLRWLTQWLTRSGHPVASAASVRGHGLSAMVCDLMPGFEFFARREPYFGTLAGCMLGRGVEHQQGHCVHPFIWAALAHRPRPATPEPQWQRDHEGHYEHPASHYSLIRHRYQTGVVWRGLSGYRGLQTFALGGEAPAIHPSHDAGSTLRAGAVDTARRNVEAGPNGWEVFRRTGGPGDGYEPESPATVVTSRKGGLWECCVFTRASVVLVAGGPRGLRARWALHMVAGDAPRLDRKRRQASFAKRRARVLWLGGAGRIVQARGTQLLEVRARSGLVAFGFGGAQLRLERLDARRERLHFRDASGRYILALDAVVTPEGDLNRAPSHWHRLRRT